jgi:hypothetical protein
METVAVDFKELEGVLKQLIESTAGNKLAIIDQVDMVTPKASGTMSTAVEYFRAGQGTCSTSLSEKNWEIAMEESGALPFLLQKSLTEYYLLASGHAQAWQAAAAAALVAHNGYIMEEAAAPILVEAVQEFKEAWNSYRSTDEERRLGLQVAYITMNPYPAGGKDALDVAPGDADYHKQYF